MLGTAWHATAVFMLFLSGLHAARASAAGAMHHTSLARQVQLLQRAAQLMMPRHMQPETYVLCLCLELTRLLQVTERVIAACALAILLP